VPPCASGGSPVAEARAGPDGIRPEAGERRAEFGRPGSALLAFGGWSRGGDGRCGRGSCRGSGRKHRRRQPCPFGAGIPSGRIRGCSRGHNAARSAKRHFRPAVRGWNPRLHRAAALPSCFRSATPDSPSTVHRLTAHGPPIQPSTAIPRRGPTRTPACLSPGQPQARRDAQAASAPEPR
jgi:hypothetical protein